jgi:hypothetical protein
MWGEQEEFLQVVEMQTGETPAALANKPRLWPWLLDEYKAFWMLDAGRLVTRTAVRPIQLAEMLAYVTMFGVEKDDRSLFVKKMRALDWIYVTYINAEIKRKVQVSQVNAERKRER